MTDFITHRILVIDDQAAIHEDYRKILGKQSSEASTAFSKAAAELFGDDPATIVEWEGFEVDSAYQGQEGFELVQRSVAEGRPYAMAFVDIRMPPGWDGVETVRHIWEIDPEILIVICSAYSDYTWQELVRELGRNDRYLILKKPFDNIEVRQCAMTLTERWSVSRTDVLTGLLNRRAFHNYLNLEWQRATRHALPLACAMLDLDGFKQVNDKLGHLAGDQVLKSVAQSMQAKCRAGDWVCRYGGDEICVLLPHTSAQEASLWAENTRRTLEASVAIGPSSASITVSIGISERLGGEDRMEQLVNRADQALMRAKALGRNRLVLYSPSCETRAEAESPSNRADPWKGVVLRDVMITPVICVDVVATLGQAVECLAQFHVSSAPVVDADGQFVGIVSLNDVFGMLGVDDAWTTPVREIMRRESGYFNDDTPLDVIVSGLATAPSQCAFILREGRPFGMVSRNGLLSYQRSSALSPAENALPTALRISGQLDSKRVIEGAKAIAQCAMQLSQTPTPQAGATSPSLVSDVARLQVLVDRLWLYSEACNPAPIISSGPDMSAFGTPSGPMAPTG
jgi:diguanylate cyclase (GGDEF)-like protein